MKTAVFPGSFDPITVGHESVVNRSLELFDKLIVAIGINSTKSYLFPLEKRMEMIRKTFGDKVEIDSYEGLTIDYCKRKNAKYILRGLRTSADFEFERGIAQMNQAMNPGIETIFILTTPEFSAINSTIVRDILRNNGDASMFLPEGIRNMN